MNLQIPFATVGLLTILALPQQQGGAWQQPQGPPQPPPQVGGDEGVSQGVPRGGGGRRSQRPTQPRFQGAPQGPTNPRGPGGPPREQTQPWQNRGPDHGGFDGPPNRNQGPPQGFGPGAQGGNPPEGMRPPMPPPLPPPQVIEGILREGEAGRQKLAHIRDDLRRHAEMLMKAAENLDRILQNQGQQPQAQSQVRSESGPQGPPNGPNMNNNNPRGPQPGPGGFGGGQPRPGNGGGSRRRGPGRQPNGQGGFGGPGGPPMPPQDGPRPSVDR
ncbi:MAG: hypothetical protein HY286_11610 [Planctomycetes bacterium]|nr:hypothetical protein [Planctomycetota bacterium]